MKIIKESINPQKLDELYEYLRMHLNRSFFGSISFRGGKNSLAVDGSIRMIQHRSHLTLEASDPNLAFDIEERDIEDWSKKPNGALIKITKGIFEVTWG